MHLGDSPLQHLIEAAHVAKLRHIGSSSPHVHTHTSFPDDRKDSSTVAADHHSSSIASAETKILRFVATSSKEGPFCLRCAMEDKTWTKKCGRLPASKAFHPVGGMCEEHGKRSSGKFFCEGHCNKVFNKWSWTKKVEGEDKTIHARMSYNRRRQERRQKSTASSDVRNTVNISRTHSENRSHNTGGTDRTASAPNSPPSSPVHFLNTICNSDRDRVDRNDPLPMDFVASPSRSSPIIFAPVQRPAHHQQQPQFAQYSVPVGLTSSVDDVTSSPCSGGYNSNNGSNYNSTGSRGGGDFSTQSFVWNQMTTQTMPAFFPQRQTQMEQCPSPPTSSPPSPQSSFTDSAPSSSSFSEYDGLMRFHHFTSPAVAASSTARVPPHSGHFSSTPAPNLSTTGHPVDSAQHLPHVAINHLLNSTITYGNSATSTNVSKSAAPITQNTFPSPRKATATATKRRVTYKIKVPITTPSSYNRNSSSNTTNIGVSDKTAAYLSTPVFAASPSSDSTTTSTKKDVQLTPSLGEHTTFNCSHCSYKSPKMQNLQRHIRSMHQVGGEWARRKFPCLLCDYVATQSCNLNRHKRGVHKMAVDTSKGKKKLVC